MSLSAPRQTLAKNPAELFITWKGGDEQGYFEYYDKEQEDRSKRNVRVDLKDFVVLDKDLFNITGWDDDNRIQYISNEVREVTDLLVVKAYQKSTDGKPSKNWFAHTGTYEQLKDLVKNSKVLKYTRSVYIGWQGRLCHVQLTGAAFSQWIKDVESNSNFQRCLISHVKNETGKKGNVKYLFPHFNVGEPMDPETLEQMTAIDRDILQPYLKEYLARNKKGSPESTQTSAETTDVFPKEQWRRFKLPDGHLLCNMKQDDIRDVADQYAEAGDVESAAFDCLNQALMDYNHAAKTWKERSDKSGRKLSDYSLKELEEMYAKIPADNQYKITLEVAVDERKNEQPPAVVDVEVVEEEDIPF